MGTQYILEMKNCRKQFPGVLALDNVSLSLKRGEVHALVGENGAGKSTIMKVLIGIHKLDEGEILLDGKPFEAKHPSEALEKGISMVPQEIDLLPNMTVEENIFAGREISKGLVVNKKTMLERTREAMKSLDLDIDPKTKVSNLSTSQMQMVAIVKAIAFNADIIIMDEPTSAISDREVRRLFEVIRKLKAQNKTIIYISHKMDEIFEITDRITVMRDGKWIGTVLTSETTKDELIQMMVGRDLSSIYVKDAPKSGDYDENEVLLRVEGLTRENEFENISFEVRRGEILGIYGLMGAGRTEMVETIFGLRKPDAGKIILGKDNIDINSTSKAIGKGIGFVPEDRKLNGLNLISSVKNNISIVYLYKVLRANFILNFKKEKRISDEKIAELRIKTSSRDTIVGTLSGGNQQKVILAKWLLGNPDILIMDEPTRGIDIGAKAEIYKMMDKLAKSGKSIIMISSELPELLGMSDRVIVMHEGKITGVIDRDEEKSEKTVVAYAIGERGINE